MATSSSSRNHQQQREEELYENQNDQRLDDLHSKIRTLRGVSESTADELEKTKLNGVAAVGLPDR